MATLVKKNRRALRSNKKNGKSLTKNIRFVGVNSAGLSSKLESFDSLLSNLRPSVLFVQETKFRTNGKLKTENSDKYFIYELLRKDRAGGGIAIGVDKDLDPVWVNEGIDGVEILTVEVSFSDLNVRCICGYGPQENETMENKEKFWIQLGFEVEEALNSARGIVIEMDGNLWAGPGFYLAILIR